MAAAESERVNERSGSGMPQPAGFTEYSGSRPPKTFVPLPPLLSLARGPWWDRSGTTTTRPLQVW